MNRIVRYLFQAVFYGLFCAVVYFFSVAPPYEYMREDQAEIKIVFNHATQLREPCRDRSPEELQKLPPNMRKAKECARARSPLKLELLIDDHSVVDKTFISPGMQQDGMIFVYAKSFVPSGEHWLTVRMQDSVRVEGFTHQVKERVMLKAKQGLTIGFDEENVKFIFY